MFDEEIVKTISTVKLNSMEDYTVIRDHVGEGEGVTDHTMLEGREEDSLVGVFTSSEAEDLFGLEEDFSLFGRHKLGWLRDVILGFEFKFLTEEGREVYYEATEAEWLDGFKSEEDYEDSSFDFEEVDPFSNEWVDVLEFKLEAKGEGF